MELIVPATEMYLSSDGKYYVSRTITVNKNAAAGTYKVDLVGAPTGAEVYTNGNYFLVKVPVSSVNSSTSFTVNVTTTGSINEALVYKPANTAHQNLVGLFPKTVTLTRSTKLTLTKAPEPTGKLMVSKIASDTGKALKGATLVVKNSKGIVVDEWVSDGSVHVIEGLDYGTYTLTEKYAPDGYVLSNETITFTLSEKNPIVSKVMYNSAKEVTKVSISKQDITNGKELPGARLVVKDSKGNVVDEWISGTTPHLIEGLNANEKYTLTETIAPDGYILSEETVEFTVSEDGSMTKIVMYNKPETPTEIVVNVPKTSSFKNSAFSLIGILGIGLGSLVIFKKLKDNE